MKEIYLITKALTKNSYSFSNVKRKSLFGYIVVYLMLIGYTCFFSYTITTTLSTIGMEDIALNVIFVAVLSLVLFQNVISCINILFFSKDNEHILPLPITSGKLLIAKINCMLITEYISNIIFFLPALFTYGVVVKADILFYIYSIIIFFVFPILPLVLVIFVMSILMKFTRIIRNKDIAQYISVVASIVIIFSVIGLMSNTSNNLTTEEINDILISINSVSNVMSNFFVTINPAREALINYNNIIGLKNLFYLIAETALGYIIFIAIIRKFFIKTILNANSSSSKIKLLKENSKVYNKKSLGITYFKKELLGLSRNSIYCMQCLVPSVLMPIVILLPIAVTIKNGGEDAIELINVFTMQRNPFWLGIRLIILQFLFGINFISITSISREGKDIYVLKYIPINYEKQIKYKANTGIILSIAPIIIIALFDFYVMKIIEIDLLTILFITGILSSAVFNYLLVIIDLKHPKLKWDNEYAVVKQNINMVFGLFVATIMCSIIVISSIFTESIYSYSAIVALIFMFILTIIKIYIQKKAVKLFRNIEV